MSTLHELWTAAVGTPGYSKEDWKALQRLVDRGQITNSFASAPSNRREDGVDGFACTLYDHAYALLEPILGCLTADVGELSFELLARAIRRHERLNHGRRLIHVGLGLTAIDASRVIAGHATGHCCNPADERRYRFLGCGCFPSRFAADVDAADVDHLTKRTPSRTSHTKGR